MTLDHILESRLCILDGSSFLPKSFHDYHKYMRWEVRACCLQIVVLKSYGRFCDAAKVDEANKIFKGQHRKLQVCMQCMCDSSKVHGVSGFVVSGFVVQSGWQTFHLKFDYDHDIIIWLSGTN